MWLKMVEFETSYLESYFKVALTRGEDTEAISLFGENTFATCELDWLHTSGGDYDRAAFISTAVREEDFVLSLRFI